MDDLETKIPLDKHYNVQCSDAWRTTLCEGLLREFQKKTKQNKKKQKKQKKIKIKNKKQKNTLSKFGRSKDVKSVKNDWMIESPEPDEFEAMNYGQLTPALKTNNLYRGVTKYKYFHRFIIYLFCGLGLQYNTIQKSI